MIVSIANILNSEQVLTELSAKKIPARAAFKVSRLIQEIRKEMEVINQTRVSLTERYGERDDDGKLKVDTETGTVPIKKECMDDFMTQLEELLSTEITLSADAIPVSVIEDMDLTPLEAERLESFIDVNG